jgi:hypothetical protein
LKPDFGRTNWLVLPKVYGSMLRLNFLCFWQDPAQAADVMRRFPPNYKLNRGNEFQTFYYPGYPILRNTFRLAKMVSWAVSYPRSMKGIDVADIETQRAYFELHHGQKLFTPFGTLGDDTDYNLSA